MTRSGHGTGYYDPALLSTNRYDSAQRREHEHAYSTRRRSESFQDLRAAGRAPPNIRRNKW